MESCGVGLLTHQEAVLERIQCWEQNPRCSLHVLNHAHIHVKCGIYCDKAGTGKTAVLVKLMEVAENPVYRENVRVTLQNTIGTVEVDQNILDKVNVACNLVVVHQRSVTHWMDEIRRFSPAMVAKTACIRTTNDVASFATETLQSTKVVVCSALRWRQFGETVAIKYGWLRVIYDRVDCLRIPKNPVIMSSFYWFVGTEPQSIGSLSTGFLRDSFYNLINLTHDLRCLFPCKRYLYREMIISTPDSDLEASIGCPDPISTTTLVLMSPSEFAPTNRIDAVDHNRVKELLPWTDVLSLPETVGRHQLLHNKRITEFESNVAGDCPVCLDPLVDSVSLSLCCYRLFCVTCVIKCVHNTHRCPMCRASLQYSDILRISRKTLPRFDALIQSLHASKERVLVYDDRPIIWTSAMNRLKIPYKLVNNRTISSMQTEEQACLTVLTQTNGVEELCIPNVDHLVVLSSVSTKIQNQLVGYCARIGRIRQLRITRLRF